LQARAGRGLGEGWVEDSRWAMRFIGEYQITNIFPGAMATFTMKAHAEIVRVGPSVANVVVVNTLESVAEQRYDTRRFLLAPPLGQIPPEAWFVGSFPAHTNPYAPIYLLFELYAGQNHDSLTPPF